MGNFFGEVRAFGMLPTRGLLADSPRVSLIGVTGSCAVAVVISAASIHGLDPIDRLQVSVVFLHPNEIAWCRPKTQEN